MRREEDNPNWGGPRQGAGRPPGPSVKVSLSLGREAMKSFRDACDASQGRLVNNGDSEEIMQALFEKVIKDFIEASKPEPKWTVTLFYNSAGPWEDSKELQEVKDLSEEDALKFAIAHQNVEVEGKICNYIIAQQQGSRTNVRRWKAGEKPEHLKFHLK